MSENAKTTTFVVIGMLAVVVGLVSQPKSAELEDDQLIGQNLTNEFDSPDEAKRLRIVRFDEATASLSNFEVAEKDGLWSIPSKNDYPADAAQQMAQAATSLMDRKILGVATKSAGDHEEYGVVDPLSPKLEQGQKGVGTRVTMSDTNNKPMVDLIIGKAVKGAEGQRYVREADRDIVYIIEIDPTKLTTHFEDWIEKDLLKLNSWDLQQVAIKDYSAELVQGITPDGQLAIAIDRDRRAEMTFAYNDTDAKWSPVSLKQFDAKAGGDGQYVDFKLAEDEELNSEKLNGLKTALDDLQIVDVVRKPAGLSQDLKAGTDFLNNRETRLDLMTKGFTAAPGEDPSAGEIISSDGEVIATMKNGTEYVLRFGDLTSAGSDGAPQTDAAAKTEGDQKPGTNNGVNRYLFVMARFNETAVKQPELEQLPELPPGASQSTEAKPAEAPTGDAAAAAENSDAATPAANENGANGEAASAADATAPGENTESSDQDEQNGDSPPSPFVDPAQDESNPADSDSNESAAGNAAAQSGEASANTPATGSENPNQAQPTTEPAATPAADKPAVDAPAGVTPAAASEASQETKTDAAAPGDEKAKELEKIIADRKRIEQENQRKLDEYQETLKKGRENVKDLNLRFGDWYFVVSDEVFKKIRLGRNDVIKKKEKKEDAKPATGGGTTRSTEGAGSDSAADSTAIPGLPPIPGTDGKE
jgi:hypothetical protein